MSVKRSEEFIYFQNKARHYDNLKKIKPAVRTSRAKSSLSHTIDTGEYRHQIPEMQRY